MNNEFICVTSLTFLLNLPEGSCYFFIRESIHELIIFSLFPVHFSCTVITFPLATLYSYIAIGLTFSLKLFSRAHRGKEIAKCSNWVNHPTDILITFDSK